MTNKIITDLRKTKLREHLGAKKAQSRTLNDVEKVPTKGFKRQLATIDPNLDVVFNQGTFKWEIWSFPDFGQPYLVMTVQTKNKTYKELSQQVLLQMQYNVFTANNLTAKQVCAYLEEMEAQEAKRKEKEFKNKIEAISLETFSFSHEILSVQVPQAYKIERVSKNA